MKQFKLFFIIPVLFLISINTAFSQVKTATKHTVMADGHPMAVWEKSVENPKGIILLHHGRTRSSIPDFDLQVEGEDLSLMDGFNDRGYSVWALDARGYGGTPRDETGWNTPNRAAKDLSIVLDWLVKRTGQKINVWGWSMGSMISQLTAQLYPENFASLTLFGYPVRYDNTYPDDIQNGKPPMKKNTAEAAASDFITPGSISQKAIDEYVRASLEADPVRADWRNQEQYNQFDPKKSINARVAASGEFDPLAETKSHAKAFPEFPNANKQWVVLKGGDHAALLEKPRAQLIDASINFIEWLKK